jgi:hypothetical protein
MIMSRLIDPVGDALEFTLLGFDKVVSVDLLRGLAPLLSGILEVANGLFLLGIHTDDGILMTFKHWTLDKSVTCGSTTAESSASHRRKDELNQGRIKRFEGVFYAWLDRV